jgi:putative flippase GtrA
MRERRSIRKVAIGVALGGKRGELLRYLFWGLLSFLFNYGFFFLLTRVLDYRAANLIAMIATRIFVYCANKLFVFKTKTRSAAALFLEMGRFVLARSVSSAIDYFGLIALVELLKWNVMAGKLVMTGVVIACNYILSKFVFLKGGVSNDGS